MTKNKSNYIYTTMKNLISSYQWLPGEQHSILEIATKLDVSRTPVSDAVKMLSAEGLVTIVPHKGFIVGKAASDKDIKELHEIKELLEGLAAYKAATNADKVDKEELREILYRQKNAVESMDFKATSMLDRELHFKIFDMSGSDKLIEMVKPLWYVGISYDSWIINSEQLEEIYKEHVALVDAICEGRADDAKHIIESHCRRFLKRLLDKSSSAESHDFDSILNTEGLAESLLTR